MVNQTRISEVSTFKLRDSQISRSLFSVSKNILNKSNLRIFSFKMIPTEMIMNGTKY